MAETIKYLVVENVRATLAAVSGAAPYNYDFRKGQVFVFGKTLEAAAVFPVVVIYETEDTGSDEANGYDERTLRLTLSCGIRLGNRDEVRRAVDRFVGDVQRALHADYQRGGYAIDTHVDTNSTALDDSELPAVFFEIGATIQYRHAWGDPTSLAPTF